MSWRPQLLVYGLVVLALAGVPADRESRLDAYETRAQRALLYLEISTLARELERCEATFKTDCEMGAGLQLPRVCNRFAEALEGIARTTRLRLRPRSDSCPQGNGSAAQGGMSPGSDLTL